MTIGQAIIVGLVVNAGWVAYWLGGLPTLGVVVQAGGVGALVWAALRIYADSRDDVRRLVRRAWQWRQGRQGRR